MSDLLSAEETLNVKGYLAETIVGTSMYPLLKGQRDTVVIENVTEPLQKYDVVLFRRKKQLVLHRIIKIRKGFFLIRGDNCMQNEVVYDNQIIGTMTQFCRNGKFYSVSDKGYRLYSIIWVRLFFMRVIYKKVICILKRILRRQID